MKLDRNINPDGLGKYRLWNERKQVWVDDCGPGEEHEYFVIMLKDRNAGAALDAYGAAISQRDPEFASEVHELANRAALHSRFCQDPD